MKAQSIKVHDAENKSFTPASDIRGKNKFVTNHFNSKLVSDDFSWEPEARQRIKGSSWIRKVNGNINAGSWKETKGEI